MPWAIIRITGGERFLCKVPEKFLDVETFPRAVEVEEVYALTTLTIMGPTGPSRMTMLEYPDLQAEEPLKKMTVQAAAFYEISEERAKKEIQELETAMEQAKKAQEAMRQQQESNLVQARLAPAGPVGGPHLGNIFKPPGVR